MTLANRGAWSSIDPRAWLAENAAIRGAIYPEECDLSFGDVFGHRDTVRLRFSQGGVRLDA
jgi:hypothetical protein